MRTLVLGAGGMLGQAVAAVLEARDVPHQSALRSDVDMTNTQAVGQRLAEGFDAVVNCAAFTAVDDCETQEERATEVNGHAVGRLAVLCARRGVSLVHVSSDYVFSGEGGQASSASNAEPYTEQDPVAPVSAYGRSKELGERLALEEGALVVRASWLFGPGGPNFVATMVRLAEAGKMVQVVDDQIGCPTYTLDLAQALVDLVTWARCAPGKDAPKLFQFSSPSPVSWFGFATAIFEVFEKDVDLRPCSSRELPRPAPRPAYSVLSAERLQTVLDRRFRGWRHGLAEYRSLLQAE